jgi:hypothetical protein
MGFASPRPHLRRAFARLLALVGVFLSLAALLPPTAHAWSVAQENNRLLSWTGKWASTTTTRALGGALKSSVATGAVVTVAFDGTSLTWIGRRGSGQGWVQIRLDGVYKGAVNLARLGSKADHVILWRVTGLRYGCHQVTLRALRSRDASDSGSISVDAFATDGRFGRVLQRATFGYPWKTYILIDKSQFRLYWVREGWIVKAYKIAIGRLWSWTPQAIWKVGAKYKTYPLGVYGPRKMRLYRRLKTTRGYGYVYTAYGIHGTNEPWVIGTMASHGCIRLYNSDILELWPQVPLGPMVITRD